MEGTGVRRRRERRIVEVPAGPRTRAAEAQANLEEHRRQLAERQRLCRARRNAETLQRNAAASEATQSAEGDGSHRPNASRSTIKRHADRITDSLMQQLLCLDNADLRAAVLQKVFKNVHVRPLLPAYYPSAEDARCERQILKNIRAELQRTKIPHNSSKLVRKRAILEAVVSEIDADFSRFHRILGTNKSNVEGAIDRLRIGSTTVGARFDVPSRRKREGGIPDAVKLVVTTWWTEESRVSPNRKDIRRKRLGRNVYDTHAAHLLLETQVVTNSIMNMHCKLITSYCRISYAPVNDITNCSQREL